MPGLDWGPFPQLAASLRLHSGEVPLAWLDRLGQTGYPWQHVARMPADAFWPAHVLEVMPVVLPQFPARPWWMRWKWPPARALAAIDGQALARLMPFCHAWLATENTRFLAPWLVPDPRVCPPWVGNTSDRALVWSLLAFAASSNGPAVILTRTALMEKALLDEHAVPGDLLVLHHNVERLAAFWLEQTGRYVGNDLPLSTRAGGLRTEAFYHALLALPSEYKNAILLLASNSPLTRLAYLDLLADTPHPGLFAPLTSMLSTYDRDSAPWLTLLANTLLGAVLSVPPAYAAWKSAVAEARLLKADSARRGILRERWKKIELRVQQLQPSARVISLARLETWHKLMRIDPTAELHVMVLDRLARLAAVRATPGMRDEWRRIRRADPMALASVELFQPNSAYYAELTSLLLAGSLDELRQLCTTAEQSRLSELLDDLLNVSAPTEMPSALGKFWDDVAGVRLPFRPRNHRGPCPATIFSELLVALMKILPSPPSAANTATPEETDDAYAAE